MFLLLLILAVSPKHFTFFSNYTITSLSDFKINTTKKHMCTHTTYKKKKTVNSSNIGNKWHCCLYFETTVTILLKWNKVNHKKSKQFLEMQ